MSGAVSPSGIFALAQWLRRTMLSRLRLRFLLEIFHGELRFANHEHAARAQTEDCGRAGENCHSGGSAEEGGLTIVSNDGAADRDERGGGKQSESGVEAAKRLYEELRAQVQGSELLGPDL